MKLLLTSAGIKNMSIRNALVDLLGKPIEECNALCIPTAIYAFPGGSGSAWKLIAGRAASPLCELGWKSLGVLELTALPSIEKALWTTAVEEARPPGGRWRSSLPLLLDSAFWTGRALAVAT